MTLEKTLDNCSENDISGLVILIAGNKMLMMLLKNSNVEICVAFCKILHSFSTDFFF